MDVLCSDKTGTLTKGEMAVTVARLSDGSVANCGQLVTLHGEVWKITIFTYSRNLFFFYNFEVIIYLYIHKF